MRNLMSFRLHKKICKMLAYAMLVNINIGWMQIIAFDQDLVGSDEQHETVRAPKIDYGIKQNDQMLAVVMQKMSDLELIKENLEVIKNCMGPQIKTTRDGQTIDTVYEYLNKILNQLGSNRGSNQPQQAMNSSMTVDDVSRVVNEAISKVLVKMSSIRDLPMHAPTNFSAAADPIAAILAIVQALQACLLDPNDQCCPAVCLKDRIKAIQCNVSDIRCTVNDIDCNIDNVLCNQVSIFSKVCAIKCEEDVILSKVSDIQSKIDNLQFGCCSSLESIIDRLDACGSTVIFGPTTITASGTYCLANNIVGASPAIVIDADNVVLNLNGHLISNAGVTDVVGVRVMPNHSFIVIKNGFMKPVGINLIGTGIDIQQNVDSVRIENVMMNAWNVGVSANEVSNLVISDVQADGNTDGIIINNCLNVSIENAYIVNSIQGITLSGDLTLGKNVSIGNSTVNDSSIGLVLNSMGAVNVENCSFDGNGAGVVVQDSKCVTLTSCTAMGRPTSAGSGFDIASTSPQLSSADILLKDCTACGYDIGFSSNDVNGLCIFDCTAKANNIGFDLTGASNRGIIKNSTATNNNRDGAGIGFADDGISGDNQYYANRACGNNQFNYQANIDTAVVTSADNARGATNVDCSNTTPDSVEETLSTVDVISTTLDECCSVIDEINSKIDDIVTQDCSSAIEILESNLDVCCSIIEDISEDIICVCEGIEDIESQLDVIEDTLEECCTTLNSKIDALVIGTNSSQLDVIESALEGCCITLNSKIDALVIGTNSSQLDVIESILEDCCTTLNSKIDALVIGTNSSQLDIIESALEGCCTTLNSKVDALSTLVTNDFNHTFTAIAGVQSSLGACCTTLNSKVDALSTLVTNDFNHTFTAIAGVQSSLSACCTTLNSKVDALSTLVTNDFNHTFTAIAGVQSSLSACCTTLNSKVDALSTLVTNDFNHTFTAIAGVQSSLGTCCSRIESLDNAILSKVNEIDTKIDGLFDDFQSTWTILASFQNDVENNFDIVFDDFQSTWTLIGDVYDASFDCTSFTTTASIDAANLNVIQWLKTIYRDLRGFAGPCVS